MSVVGYFSITGNNTQSTCNKAENSMLFMLTGGMKLSSHTLKRLACGLLMIMAVANRMIEQGNCAIIDGSMNDR